MVRFSQTTARPIRVFPRPRIVSTGVYKRWRKAVAVIVSRLAAGLISAACGISAARMGKPPGIVGQAVPSHGRDVQRHSLRAKARGAAASSAHRLITNLGRAECHPKGGICAAGVVEPIGSIGLNYSTAMHVLVPAIA